MKTVHAPKRIGKKFIFVFSFTHRVMRKSALTLLLTSLAAVTACNTEKGTQNPPKSKWISEIIAYHPAPGQFINTTQGNEEASAGIIGGKRGCLSLGGFGGYVIFAFDHDVRNIDGTDFVIFGNAFDGSSEPGIVEVSPDGTTWYRLKGSDDAAPTPFTITYTRPAQTETAEDIAWTDGNGNQGMLQTVPAHSKNSYWPLSLPSSSTELTFSGYRLANNSSWNASTNRFVLSPYEWGYADNWSADYDAMAGNDSDTRGSNKFDLDNAVDSNGNPVTLTSVNQIKVYSAMNQWVGAGVGETSTEVCGALSLSASIDD